MQLRLLINTLLVGLAALSCQPTSTQLPVELATATTLNLPAVSMAPSEFAPRPDIDPDEALILRYLESRHTGLSRFEEAALARAIVRQARMHEIEPSLVLAVIQVESGGYHLARSPVGALGLMQLLPSTAVELAEKLGQAWHGPDSLFDPVLNVTLGIAYLRELSDRYESVPHALAAYNWGPGRIDRRLRRGDELPRIYVKQVMRAYDSTTKLRS